MKSALPDAARDASGLSFVLQTAPLCPTNVPTQSPVHSLNIGFPSLQLEIRRYVPSSCSAEKFRCVTGRVWPGATRGTGRDIVVVLFVKTDAKTQAKTDKYDDKKMRTFVCVDTGALRSGPSHLQ